jgi:hypothetical protein
MLTGDESRSATETKPLPSNRELEPSCTFRDVSSLGAGYLAVTWTFFKLLFAQENTNLANAFAIFSVLIQIAFLSVFVAQREERRKLLNLPKNPPWTEAHGDVALRMLNWLCCVVSAWLVLLLIVWFLTLLPNVVVRRVPMPS